MQGRERFCAVSVYFELRIGTVMYAIGIDFGTLSVRGILVDIHTGKEMAVSEFPYPHGVMERNLPTGECLEAGWALQHPMDYIEGLIYVVNEVRAKTGVPADEIVGIGVDFTSSTVIPVDKEGIPLCCKEEFVHEPHAYAKLWKHHGAEQEAEFINQVALERNEKWLDYCGGKVSGESMLPKIFETLRHAPKVYENADRMIEALDWITWVLTGTETRALCAAGYKAFYHLPEGYPSKEFLRVVDERLENLVEDKLKAPMKSIGETAGYLTEDMAKKLALFPGTPVGSGIIDAHASVLGSGISRPEDLMIIMGTSACHLLHSEVRAAIPGISGVVLGGMLPHYYGYEAGQSCVGDLFAWFVKNSVPEAYKREAEEKELSIYELLESKLEVYRTGSSGLLALDWFNGVRSPLEDFELNGLLLGMNLLTKPEEIYMALIEATAYGTRLIIENFEQAGVVIKSIVAGGGIAAKSKLVLQVYADVCNREIRVSDSAQVCALGAAMLGVAAAPAEITGYHGITDVVERLGKGKEQAYIPKQENVVVYEQLYQDYKTLTEYFGKGGNDVMKRLNRMRFG